MSKDVTDELFPEVEGTEEAEAEQVEAEAVEAEAETPEAEPEDEGENEGEPPAPEKAADQHVPVSALKDERTKRQALERELSEMRQWRQQLEAQARDRQLQSIENPDERLQAVQHDWQQRAVSQKLDMSRRFAERAYGADTVNEVVEFFNDPQHAPMSHQFLQTDDPFGQAVEYYNAQKALQEIGSDPNEYKTNLREQIKAELMAELSPTKPKTPPPSMANAPSAGGKSESVASGFDALFGDA